MFPKLGTVRGLSVTRNEFDMALFVVGINHHSASLAVRERVAFAADQLVEAVNECRRETGIEELAILSTCNRTELIGASDDADAAAEHCRHWIIHYHHLLATDVDQHWYQFSEHRALRHLINVASGLDSMVLGEPQIFGQIKSAFAVAQEAKAIGSTLNGAFHHIFAIAKKVRTDTAIGENPVSVAYAAVRLARHIFSDLGQTRALLIGAGETIELVASHLKESGVEQIVIANRSLARAEALSLQYSATAVLLSEIPEQLPHADIVISSTGSQLPILGKGAVEAAIKQRRHRPVFMVDIAVPRDIEAQVADLADVYLYTIDDLQEIIDDNRKARETEARRADDIIDQGVQAYIEKKRGRQVVDALRSYRDRSENIRHSEYEKALGQLRAGADPEKVLNRMSSSLTNKLIHPASVELRKAAEEDRQELIAAAQKLLQLGADDTQ